MQEIKRDTRRRGDTLTESVYNATMEIIKEAGYSNLTFQQIAQAAKTSRTVLYRRWSTTFDLIREIMEYKIAMTLGGELIDKIEDTGSLRGDLFQLLKLYQSIYTVVGSEIMNAVLFEISQNNNKITKIKLNATEKNMLTMRKLLEFAKTRGDKIKNVSNMTLTLPFDLIRIANILGKDVAEEGLLESLVDEILLPVFLM